MNPVDLPALVPALVLSVCWYARWQAALGSVATLGGGSIGVHAQQVRARGMVLHFARVRHQDIVFSGAVRDVR